MKRAAEPTPVEVAPIHWTEAEAALARLQAVKCDMLPNKMGWVLNRLVDGKERFLVQGPPCTVTFAPAYQDPTKFKTNPKEPDPNRKRDKWNCTLRTTDLKFANLLNKALKALTLQQMFDYRAVWNGNQFNSPAELTANLPNPVELDEKTLAMTFSCDLNADVGATRPNLVMRDFDTDVELPEDTVLGQHSILVPIIDLSDVFVGKATKSKQWIKMPTVYVKKVVSDTRVDPKAIKRVKRDD